MKMVNWGIVGAGMIANDFAIGLKSLKLSISAIAAKELTRAKDFATNFGIPNAYGSYSDLANDDSVDIVYIANLTSEHYATTKLMLEHGKHVLCEKTFCLNYQQASECFALANEKKLFLMEGIWTRFFPAMHALRKEIDSGAIGDVLMVQAAMCKNKTKIERIGLSALAGGAMYTLGVYPIQLALFVFDEYPEKITVDGSIFNDQVDGVTSVTLRFSNQRFAHCLSSMTFDNVNSATIFGSKGFIEIPDFWCPTKIIVNGLSKQFELPQSISDSFFYKNGPGMQYEAQAVQEYITNGKIEHEFMPHRHSEYIAKIVDEVFKKIGL